MDRSLHQPKLEHNTWTQNLILKLEQEPNSVFKFQKGKKRDTIQLAIRLTGKSTYISWSRLSWTQYSKANLDLKTWTVGIQVSKVKKQDR